MPPFAGLPAPSPQERLPRPVPRWYKGWYQNPYPIEGCGEPALLLVLSRCGFLVYGIAGRTRPQTGASPRGLHAGARGCLGAFTAPAQMMEAESAVALN